MYADMGKQGMRVPEPLRKYLPGAPDFIPFTKELPKDTTSAKKTKENNKAPKVKEAAKTVAGAAADTVAQVADKLKEAAV